MRPGLLQPLGLKAGSIMVVFQARAVSWGQEPPTTVRLAPSYLTLSWVRHFGFWFFFFPYALVQKLKHLDRDFVNADGVYIGLSLPCGKALASL